MGDLNLTGPLNLTGKLDLMGTDGGYVTVNKLQVVVEIVKGQGLPQGQAPPVPIPPPPSAPSDPGLGFWIYKSFNQTVTAKGKAIITQGICAQGNPGSASWPGMVQPGKSTVTINRIPINVVNDMVTILPTGACVPINSSGQ